MEFQEFDKVIGYEDVKIELKRMCDCMRNPEKYRALGVRTPQGLLLHGEPGLGKTLMAKSLIAASGRTAYTCRKDLPDGEFVKEIKRIFQTAKQNAPSIVFLDDMDKFSNEDSDHPNAEEFVTVQSCIDAMKEHEVFVLATANDLGAVPSSLLRTGRFDKIIEVQSPESACAEKIVRHYLEQKHCAADVDAAEIAHILDGRSCADLETVINEAGLYAAFDGKDKVDMHDLVRACMRLLYNAPESLAPDDEKFIDRIAYHEAGHALIAELLTPNSVNFVSVSAYTGSVCGVTSMSNPKGYFRSKQMMENRVIAILGGKAASEIVFGEVDTGANRDLHRAFDIVERFVDNYCSYGFDKWEQSSSASQELLARRDAQMASDVQRFYEQAKTLLHAHRVLLDRLAASLMERKTLLGKEVRALITDTQAA